MRFEFFFHADSVVVEPAAAGEVGRVTVAGLVAADVVGTHRLSFRLLDPRGAPFGDPFWLEYNAVEPADVAAMSEDDLRAEILRLRRENASLRSGASGSQ